MKQSTNIVFKELFKEEKELNQDETLAVECHPPKRAFRRQKEIQEAVKIAEDESCLDYSPVT